MELKVWVDGKQRVICGIAEQTTVQEVVIALAQATGRSGRYTLVEKRRTGEKMLPPSANPLQVLAQSDEVEFILRRTGASSVSEVEKIAPPERTPYRKSLPPQLKHKQKKDAIMNRKEAKRKSLTITGDGSIENISNKHDGRKTDDVIHPNASQTAPKKALMPPSFRNQAANRQKASFPAQSGTAQGSHKSEAVSPPAYRHIPTPIPTTPKKNAMMPPQLRNDYVLKPPPRPLQTSMKPSERENRSPRQQRAGNPNQSPSLQQRSYEAPLDQPTVHLKPADAARARVEFTRLVLEQHEHVNEQSLTLKSLEKELERSQAHLQSQEHNANQVKREVENVEQRIAAMEADLCDERILQDSLQEESDKGLVMQREIAKYQSEISSVNENIKDLQKRTIFLQKEIERETDYQAQRRKEISKNRYETLTSNLRKAEETNRKTISELERIEEQMDKSEAAVYEKRTMLEALNRELRQVNLQQFIRQTGAKVTVLSHEEGEDAVDHDQVTSSADYDLTQERNRLPSSGSDSGSVWV